MTDDLRERYAEALANAECEQRPRCVRCMADAVMAVRDVELERLREAARIVTENRWYERLAKAEAAIARVRALHQRGGGQGKAWCRHCSENDYPRYETPWPCDTLAALDDTPEAGHG